jgi:hypothetical protein
MTHTLELTAGGVRLQSSCPIPPEWSETPARPLDGCPPSKPLPLVAEAIRDASSSVGRVSAFKAIAFGRRSEQRRQLIRWTGVRLQRSCPIPPKRSETPAHPLDGCPPSKPLSLVAEAIRDASSSVGRLSVFRALRTSGPKPEGSPSVAPGHGTRALAPPPNPKDVGDELASCRHGCPPCSPPVTPDRSRKPRLARPVDGLSTVFAARDPRPKPKAALGASSRRVVHRVRRP